MRPKIVAVVRADINLCRVELNGYRGQMVVVATRAARLWPTGRYRHTCPSCGRYIKPGGGAHCRNCLLDALGNRPAYSWAVDRIAELRAERSARLTIQQERENERTAEADMMQAAC